MVKVEVLRTWTPHNLPKVHKGTLFVGNLGYNTNKQMHYGTIIKEISKKKDQNENDVVYVVVVFQSKVCLPKATSPDLDLNSLIK